MSIHIQTQKYIWNKRTGKKTVGCSNKNKIVGGEASNAITKLCASRATKNIKVDRSAEPLGAHWDAEMANEYNIETKHIQIYSNSK